MPRVESLEIKAEKSALVVVDVQKDFCLDKKGLAYFDRQEREKRDDLTVVQQTVNSGILPMISRARTSGLYLVIIQSDYAPGQFPDMPRLCIAGTEGWELYQVDMIKGKNSAQRRPRPL